MDLPVSKSNKRKTLRIIYPAPYSQSWEPDVLPVLMKKNREKNVGNPRVPKTKRAADSPRTWSQQFPDRPDPTLPHLKYGVFRNRRGPAPRPLPPKPERQPRMDRFSKNTIPKSIPPAKETMFRKSAEPVIRVPKEPTYSYSSSSTAVNAKPVNRKEKSRYHPVIVSRTVNQSFCRKLCLSSIMHVDIKPKINGTYNSRCLSPHYRTTPRKVTMSPVKLLNNIKRDLIHCIP